MADSSNWLWHSFVIPDAAIPPALSACSRAAMDSPRAKERAVNDRLEWSC